MATEIKSIEDGSSAGVEITKINAEATNKMIATPMVTVYESEI